MSTDYQQHELREMLQGSAGGRATVEKYGESYMEELAKAGGRATTARYGLEHMRERAAKARAARLKKHYSEPRTVEKVWRDAGLKERLRVVPYRRPGSRKRSPEMIVTAVEVEELAD